MNLSPRIHPALRLAARRVVLLSCFALAAFSTASGQIPDTTAPKTTEPVASGDTNSTFQHQIGRRLWLSGQMNFIAQAHPAFSALYSGANSLDPDYEKALSRVVTLYTGLQVSKSTEVLADVEEA